MQRVVGRVKGRQAHRWVEVSPGGLAKKKKVVAEVNVSGPGHLLEKIDMKAIDTHEINEKGMILGEGSDWLLLAK